MITQPTNYSDIAAAHNKNTTEENKNISNVLSQIQDDGPAYNDAQRRDNLVNLRPDNANKVVEPPHSERENGKEKQAELSTKAIKSHNDMVTNKSSKKNNVTWIQRSLMLFVALVITIFMFRIDARTNMLENTLSSHDDDVLDSIDTYNSELSPGFRSIKKTLKAVKQDLELIKASTVSEANIDTLTANENLQQEFISDNISIMEDEILTLKNNLKIANDKLKVIASNKDKKLNNNATVPREVSTTGWIVNLAAFTSKNKADKALKPFYAAGLSPFIQEANINGKRIYRVIIDGFSSQKDAKGFVHRANNEFGLHGGWVRKS